MDFDPMVLTLVVQSITVTSDGTFSYVSVLKYFGMIKGA
jgi:hypothetical protein